MFIKPIRASGILTKQEISILFINWKDLIITNTKLIKSLRIRRTMAQQQSTVGDILCENVRMSEFHNNNLPHCSVPCDDCLHQVLLISTLSCCSPAEARGAEARVWQSSKAVPGPPQGSRHAPFILPAQTSQEGYRISLAGGKNIKEHSRESPWLCLYSRGFQQS